MVDEIDTFIITMQQREHGFVYEGVKVFVEAFMICVMTGRPQHRFYADVADYNVPGKRLLRKFGFREFGDDEDFLCYDPEHEEEIQEKVA